MDTTEIQKTINAMPAKMSAKGLRQPNVQFWFKANEEPQAYANWKDKRLPYENGYQFMAGKTPEEAIQKLEMWLDALPSAEEARRDQFLSALGGVIDLGKELGVDVEYVNPLRDTMKRLSENILTDQREAAE